MRVEQEDGICLLPNSAGIQLSRKLIQTAQRQYRLVSRSFVMLGTSIEFFGVRMNNPPSRLRNPFGWLASLLLAFSSLAYAAAPAPDRSTAGFEIDFMEDMIDHHAMAVEMATMCEGKAIHEELRALCTRIREAQTQEIADLQAWLQAWYSDPYQPEMASSRQMEKLAQAARSSRSCSSR
jgi:hypothetical protein